MPEDKRGYNGNIPVIHVSGESMPEAWEKSVVQLHRRGLWYARGGVKDKGSMQVDSTMIMEVSNPDADLFMHKFMTCGPGDLLEYQMEMLGAKDSWVDLNPGSTKWPYHYHERLTAYPDSKGGVIDQLEKVIHGLSTRPWIRRNQAITWVPERDTESEDPPCFQRVWFFITPPDEQGVQRLNLNYHFRSKNVMIAAPMNMTSGFYPLMCYVRDKVIAKTGMNLKNGRLVDITDSYHVSARDQPILAAFMDRLEKSEAKGEIIKDRSYDRETILQMYDEDTPGTVERVKAQTVRELEERGRDPESVAAELRRIDEIAKFKLTK